FMLHNNARIAKGLGYTDENIFLAHNGQIMEFSSKDSRLTDEYISHRLISLDGYMVGYSDQEVLAERYQLQDSGMVLVQIKKNHKRFYLELRTLGLPSLDQLPDLKSAIWDGVLDICHAHENNLEAFEVKKLIKKKVQNLCWSKIGKEPLVMVCV
ncbi:MAG TPA: hypothetical protein PLQ36_03315, partial [Candidatus Gracilibacteria bacterium]|nr:hypothetical protein [Candidatus Gracilibacteria bacterium]